MKAVLLILLSLGGTITTHGQRTFGLKFYQNTDLFDAEVTDTDTRSKTTVHNVNANRLTIAFTLVSKRKVTHEIELFIPEVSKSLESMKYPMEYNLRKSSRFEGEGTSFPQFVSWGDTN